MFDVGFWEIAIIAVIALIVLGPERLPRAARTVGLWVGKARRTLAEVKRDIDRELDATELKQIKSDLSDTKDVFQDAAKTMNESVVTEAEIGASVKPSEPSESTPAPKQEEKPAVNETKATT